jgi:hypothetical protein
MPLLGLAVLCATGCTPTYQVYVDTFSELSAPLAKDVPIGVATYPESPNPVFQNQIRVKVEKLLQNEGYNVVAPDKAAYRLSFRVGTRPEEVLGYVPYHGYYRGGGYGWHRSGLGFGYTAVEPYVDVYFNQWLTMRLAQVGPGEPNEGKVVWVGQAVTETDEPDVRQGINYLLVACFQEFGIDTHGRLMIPVREDDLRIQDIKSLP